MTTTLGRPLALAVITTVCDGRGQHDTTVATDGRLVHSPTAEPWARDGSVVEVKCRRMIGGLLAGDVCDGYARIDLADPNVWEAATSDLLDLLDLEGKPVE